MTRSQTNQRLTRSQEDYLKIIWHLQQERAKATAKVVADQLSVKSPTVLSMFSQLQKAGWLEYNKTDGARLSGQGENKARKLVRKHRLIETFLETVLGMDDPLIHDEAEKLEHVISDQLMYRIDAYLGFPDKDPHGSPIPEWDKHEKNIHLNEIALNHSFTVLDLELNKQEHDYYKQMDLVAGSFWTMTEIPPGGECFLISNGQRSLAIPEDTAGKITVSLRK